MSEKETKNILLVDDHYEMLELLRSLLEDANDKYHIMSAPSAEEGLLELRMGAFDLLVTDVRLPGKSGFDLIRDARRRHKDLEVILVTAYDSEQGRKEANQLNVFRYFTKPLDTDALLLAVHEVLYGPAEVTELPTGITNIPIKMPPEVGKRLFKLQADTGAAQIVLARVDGQLAHDTGGNTRLDMPALIGTISQNMGGSFHLAKQLDSEEPFTFNYQSGKYFNVYSVNVGLHYVMSLFFDARAKRDRIGTVWVYTKQAVKDLQDFLSREVITVQEEQRVSAPSARVEDSSGIRYKAAKPLDRRESKPDESSKILYKAAKPRVEEPKPEPPPPPKPKPRPEPKPIDLGPPLDPDPEKGLFELDFSLLEGSGSSGDFWKSAVEESQAENNELMSLAQAQLQGLIEGTGEGEGATKMPAASSKDDVIDLPSLDKAKTSGLDDFWDSAVNEETQESGELMSLAEAQLKGLVAPPNEANVDGAAQESKSVKKEDIPLLEASPEDGLFELPVDKAKTSGLDDFWDSAISEESKPSGELMSFADAQAQGFLEDLGEKKEKSDESSTLKEKPTEERVIEPAQKSIEVPTPEPKKADDRPRTRPTPKKATQADLESFWDAAIAEEVDDEVPEEDQVFSLVDALRRGWISPKTFGKRLE